jgi:hypothetical protein
MRRLFVAVLAVACVVGSNPVFARHAGHGIGHSHARATTRLAPPNPQAPRANPVPAPLASPSPAPTINGPISQPAFRGLTGIGQ